MVETKICTQCYRELPLSHFYSNGNRKQSCCIDCHKSNIKKAYNLKVKTINEYKSSKGCRKCGEKRYFVLDFHHRDPNEKDFVISDKVRCKLDTMMDEIQKCDILCACCHREWHYLLENNLLHNEDYESWAQNHLNC